MPKQVGSKALRASVPPEVVDRIYRRLDGGNFGATSRDQIKAVLHAAEVEFDTAWTADTMICCDCGSQPVPSCERDGHGVVALSDLLDGYCNPTGAI